MPDEHFDHDLLGADVPELVLHANGRTWTLDASRSYTIGRDQQADISCIDRRVSRRHLVIRCDGGTWVIEDLGSANGTFTEGRRIQRIEIGHGSIVRLGDVSTGMRLDFTGASAAVSDDQARDDVRPGAGLSRGEARPKARGATDRGTSEAAATPPVVPGPRAGEVPGAPTGAVAHGEDLFRPLSQHATGEARNTHRSEGPTADPRGAAATLSIDREPSGVHRLVLGQRLRIGRAQDNELVVEGPYVSRRHAEFRPLPDGRFEIVDLGSHNGTYVNGQPVHRRRTIGPNDIVGVGHSTFRLAGDRLEEFVDTGEVSFAARNLTVTVGRGKTILDDVSFGVPEKSLVAVVGPSGSGKSTLLRALTGYRPADRGRRLYDHRDLYTQFAELRRRIGLVPQDDILHKELTVDTALKYAARLRFPGDTRAAERKARIDEVLQELKLDVHRDKKVASALRRPAQAGLRRPGTADQAVTDLPRRAHLRPGPGHGPRRHAAAAGARRRRPHRPGRHALGRRTVPVRPAVGDGPRWLRGVLRARRTRRWTSSATRAGPMSSPPSRTIATTTGAGAGGVPGSTTGAPRRSTRPYRRNSRAPPATQPPARALKPKPQRWIGQLWTLVRRYVSVIASDKGFMALMLLLPAVLGGVSCLVPAPYGLAPPPPDSRFRYNQESGTILLVLSSECASPARPTPYVN